MSQADRERSYSSQHRYRAAQKLRSSSVTRSRVDRGSASTPRRARAESRGSDLFNASVGGNSQQDHFLRTAKKSESMLCHSLGGSFCERPPKMPQTDRTTTTTTVPTAAWNQCNLRSRCDVWGAACSPRRLETVRQELAAVRADVRCLRGFLDATTIATSQLARQSVESRQHLRKLMEEERNEGAECDSALLKGPDEERERLESLAEEVSELGSQVSDLAQQQLECYKDVQYLRGFTALVRLRQRANAATLQSRNFGQQCDSKAKELDKTKEQMAALRLKAHSLREEAAKAKVEAADVGEDSALQFLEALRVELGAEEQRTKMQTMLTTAQEATQASLKQKVSQLMSALQESEASTAEAAAQVQDSEGREEAYVSRLERERSRNSTLAQEARHLVATHKSLEAELEQQYDTTRAWQLCSAEMRAEGSGSRRPERAVS